MSNPQGILIFELNWAEKTHLMMAPIYFLYIDESTKYVSESTGNFKICIIKVA